MTAADRARAAYSRAVALRDADEQIAAAGAYLSAADEFEASREAEWHATALVAAGRCFMAGGQAPQAVAPFRQATSVLRELVEARGAKARGDLARALTNLGQALGEVGDPDAAIQAFSEAMRLSRDDDESLYAWTGLSVGRLYRELKRPEEARGYLADAYDVFTRLGDDRQGAHAANNLGAVFNDLRDHERALHYFGLARSTYVGLGDKSLVAITDLNIARQHLSLRNLEAGETSIEEALRALTDPGRATTRAAALTTKSGLFWAADRREEALPPLEEAADIYERSGSVTDHASAIGTLGGHLMDLGRFEEGLRLAERSLEELEGVHDALRGTQLRAFYLDRINTAYGSLVGSYIRAGRDADALAAAERAKARTLARLLVAVVAEQDVGHHRELVEAQRKLGAVHEEIAQLGAGSPPEQLVRLERQERDFQLALRSVEATIGPSLVQPATVASAAVATTTGAVPELLLEYTLGPLESHLIAKLGDTVEAHILPPIGELEPAIRALRDDLRLGLAPTHSHSLYRTLLRPVQRLLDATDQLLIVPDGVLLDLPFAVLTSSELEEGSGLRSWSEYPWLVRSHSIRYAPSAGVAAALAARSAKRGGDTGEMAAFAAPLTDADRGSAAGLPLDATRAAAESGASLAPLPFVFEETATICRELGLASDLKPPVLVDINGFAIRSHSAATKQAVIELARTRSFRYWHFACHGLVDFDLSDHSGLVLSTDSTGGGSYWRAYEVGGVSMPCELATLSACDTGRGRQLRGEGVFGLARAFLTAGADAVCVSMWPVVDRSAAALMADFYRALARGEDKPNALRLAQSAAIDRDLHARHWGPYTLIGTR
ncbi:MAG: CHAT domain-containing protein [Thermoleophilaceae bacterium]